MHIVRQTRWLVRRNPMRCATFAARLFLIIASIARSGGAQSDGRSVVDDSRMFSVIVTRLITEVGGEIRVSPIPLSASASVVSDEDEFLVENDDRVVRARIAVLRSAGVVALTGKTHQGCWGVLVPLAPDQNRDSCPKVVTFTAAVSLSRAGGPMLPGGRPSQFKVQKGDRTVRVILTKLSADGSYTEVYDWVLRKVNTTWAIAHRELLIYLH